MDVIEIVESIRALPGAFVDCGYLQGRDAVLKQFQRQEEEISSAIIKDPRDANEKAASADRFISLMQQAIREVIERAQPYELPKDYIIFLQNYGGIMIEGEKHNFATYGIGPMVEDWYGYLNTADHVLMETGKLGWLSLGRLVFRKGHKYDYQRVQFLLDLSGSVQKNSVIGIGPWDGQEREELILSNLQTRNGMWTSISSSFAEWLELARDTTGEFVYG
jgi:hypothetical protein